MKNIFNRTSRVIITALLFCTVQFAFGQNYYLELQEIIHNSADQYPAPTYFVADENGGEMRFQVVYYTSQGPCPETFKFKWSFGQNMKTLPGIDDKVKDYSFHIFTEKTSGNCGEVNPWRNPTVTPSADHGGYSRIINSEPYVNKGYGNTFSKKMDPSYLYFRNDESVRKSPGRKTGHQDGVFTVYTAGAYEGVFAYFHFTVAGGSNKNYAYQESMNHEIVYLYKLIKGTASTLSSSNPCEMVEPDCSCCPGATPVWNFKTNQGDCLCQKGQAWDDLKKRCVDVKNIVIPPDDPFVQLQQPPSYDIRNWKQDHGPYKISGTQIDANPETDGYTSYYIAPNEFKDDWRRHSKLRFDKKSSGGSYAGAHSWGAKGDVIIKNGSLTASYDIAQHHNGNWKTFSVPLNGSGWTLSGGANRLSDVLRNVTEFKISPEYGEGTDKSSLRNVSF